tara:strand:- start:2419 stop:2676 length:258 start_codon:yes stop_codon:yes gene_type:complete
MAVGAWLCTKTDNGPIIDGIVNCVINADDAGTEANTLADADASLIAAGHPVQAGYFNTAVIFLTAYPTDLDAVIFTDRSATVYEA